MGRKSLCMAGILWLLVMPVLAGQMGGQLRVTLQREGQPLEGCTVEILRAGEAVEGGYRLNEDFGGGMVAAEDLFSHKLAAWMAGGRGQGLLGITDRDGTVCFRDLSLGLYLVRQPEGELMEPYLVYLSEEMPEVDTCPPIPSAPIPRTGDEGILSWALVSLFSGLGLLALAKRDLRAI